MNQKNLSAPEKWILCGIPVLFLAGSILHFLYDLTGKTLIAALFSPVNESIWEHIKLAVIPVILWWSLYYIFRGKQYGIEKDKWFEGALYAVSAAIIFIPMLYYFYTGAFGVKILWIDILILLAALSAGQLLGLHIYRCGKGINTHTVLLIFAGILLFFILFTFLPPRIPLFQDSVTGGYSLHASLETEKIPEAKTSGIKLFSQLRVNALTNVWVTENGGNTGIQPGFVADALQTVED